ncbi:hypothetical protein PLUTO_00480 [Luteibacter phage vB_LflM-Pluto]|uniref:Uncharacterized protein n=1 Tax=Luteibacter phage vB_LflM-Pluto TaxID=2948611 RepID=A0A9E7MTR7_9CAUD|nr:hypothetical protein PLUTO_00480 [Luteibacter phage vB_LflM-Pluto]
MFARITMKTIDDIPWKVERRWDRKLKLIAKHINELAAEIKAEIGPEAALFIDDSPMMHIMDGDDHGVGLIGPSSAERQAHVIMAGPLLDVGHGAW